MAGNPITTVKANLRPALAALMPATTADASVTVPVFYRYPGDATVPRECVWFHGSETTYAVTALRAGRRRRTLTVRFDVVAQVLLEGPTVVEATDNTPLNYDADLRCDALITVVDEYIADEEHLATASLVDVAWVESTRQEYGVQPNGAWSRAIARVAFHARVL
jgi:hypothetical protein